MMERQNYVISVNVKEMYIETLLVSERELRVEGYTIKKWSQVFSNREAGKKVDSLMKTRNVLS